MLRFNRIGMNLLLRLFVLLILGLTHVMGQPKNETRLFSCFIWQDLGLGKVFYAAGDDPKELIFQGKRRSEYYPIPFGGTFRLFVEKDVAGKVGYEVVGETPIKSASKRILLIVTRNPMANDSKPGALPLRITVLDDSINSFPGGSTKFINLTAKPLSAEINGRKAVVDSNRSELIRPSIPENGGFVPLFIRYEGITLYGTRIYCQKGERRIIFIRPNTKNDPQRPIALEFLPQIVGPSFEDQ